MKLREQMHLLEPFFSNQFSVPNCIALRENDIVIDRKLLKKKVCSLAKSLSTIGMEPHDRIAIALPRGLNAAVPFLVD
jgi:hypothetical protein